MNISTLTLKENNWLTRPFTQLVVFFSLLSTVASAQLGVYEFTGNGTCPNQNPAVTAQPSNAVFSDFTNVNANCKATNDQFAYKEWNTNSSIDLSQYNQFTITPGTGYALNLASIVFTQQVDKKNNSGSNGSTTWALRSSVDGYSANIATGTTNENWQSPVVTLPAGSFSNLGIVTFRLYIIDAKDNGATWFIDDVTVNGTVITAPVDPSNPSSDSPQCSVTGVTLSANGTAPAGETWYWQTAATGTSTANSASSFTVFTSGTYYLRSQDNTSLVWSTGAGSIAVTVTQDVTTPVFSLGATSIRCQGATAATYTATATNTTGIIYTLDAASLAGGNTINASNGAVTYSAGWFGTTVITAQASGCSAAKTATHTVTINPTVGTPVFSMGSNSLRCLGAGSITFTATAINNTGITYSIDALSAISGNTINPSTGTVNFAVLWVGNTTITATATGCGGPKTATHTVAISAAVGTPAFLSGTNSTRCKGAGTVTYTANASNTSGITYSLDATSTAAGNSIDAATGIVTYIAAWTGTSTITASAAGCNGPKTATHTAVTNALVTTPVFTVGSTSTRCQAAGTVTYTATASNTTGITYSLDAASITGGNTINASNGTVTFAGAWNGTTTITAKAAGCSGPLNATHTVTVTGSVTAPSFSLGATSTRCQGAGSVTYTAASTNTTGITYSLDAASVTGGNTINASNGTVTYNAGWSGTSTITASAAGCNGPKASSHTVTVTPSVATPVFTLGTTSSRAQSAGTVTYTATATNNTGITYSLDAASLAAGNTINTANGQVTYLATWNGSTIITASAAGCNGPKTASHIVTINSSSVFKQLYFSDPSQSLDRIDPVNTNDVTTANSGLLSTTGTNNTTFTMNPALCDALVIKAGTITVRAYVTVSSGTMPATPAITALLQYGSTTIGTMTNPTFSGGMLTWTLNLASSVTVPAGSAISLKITTAVAGVIFRLDYDSQTKPSRIDLPVTTFININSLDVYSAAYPAGIPVTTGIAGSVKYIRATVSDPFGAADITALNIKITPGAAVAGVLVNTSGCLRTYEYAWTVPATSGSYSIVGTAKEGFENTVTHTKNTNFSVCTTCAPVAVNDSASGAGGNPIVTDVLANDYDPNNNMNPASLAITVEPKNGSAYISNNNIVYLPNGTYEGNDTLTYTICDLTSPTPLCTTGQVFFSIDPMIIDICADASKTHTYYVPYPEQQAYTALLASSNTTMPSNTIQTVISIKVPYPGMKIVWDEWEDGYEANALNPTQATTKVWGDGNPFNGIAPGYSNDIIPAGGSIILDNTMIANPRNAANIYYDGKDKIVSTGQIAVTQVSGEPTRMPVQAIKTNVTSVYDFGQSFTIPLGEDFPSRDFKYTALFIRASENNTVVSIDKDNNGTFETTATLNEGETYFVNGGVQTGATVASDKPVGVELNAGGVDQYSIRNAPIYPATWYSNTYYTPVPTSDNPANNPKDSSVVMFYNSLNRAIKINWYSGAPANGVINVPAKSAVRFPLAYSATAAYKFVNPTGESFTAIEIIDSYTPNSSVSDGTTYDWSFNLISEARLTDYTTVAWAPGGLDLVAPAGPDVNGNPIWVTPTMNTTIYVKYDGNITGTGGLTSPCGLKYDIAYNVNALNYIKIRDLTDNDQSGIAIYTCNGAKIAAVYGEDPQGSTTGIGIAFWDVGSTIQPFCKQKIVIAADDYATTLVSQPVTITVLNNDLGFLATIDPSTVKTIGLLQPKHGTVHVNDNGTILYTPQPGFSGVDTFEYNVCSTPAVVCDIAMVVVKISTCPSNGNQNVISGQIFMDKNKDGNNNDGGKGLAGVKVYLYTDGNCSATINANELTDSTTVDSSGFYQFTKYPEKTVEDNFDDGNGGKTCNNGTDGDSPWAGNWTDNNDPSNGFCNTTQTPANTDVEITKDAAFGYALRLKDNNVSATRSVDLNNVTKAFLTFSYRRKSATLTSGHDVQVQVAKNGTAFTTIYTIAGDGSTDADYITVYNQDISSYTATTTAIRFLTNNNVGESDTVYVDNVSIRFLRYPQCYIAAVNLATLPANYTATTATLKSMTISSGGSCSSQFDFGFAKPNVTISGMLYNDKNGLTDNAVNGVATGAPNGATFYAYLADKDSTVLFKTTVSASTGNYSFTQAEITSNYIVVLSTISKVVGEHAPVTPGCPHTWVGVGEAYGVNNAAGTGNEAGIPNVSVPVKTGSLNVTGVNFGIQRAPSTDDYLRSITHPVINQVITLNGVGVNPPVLSGMDAEDCTSGCQLMAKNVVIDTIPSVAEMYYNNGLVVSGQLITNFNPSLLQLKITAASTGATAIQFSYSYVDAAMMKDPTPASYELVWLVPVPVVGLTATAEINGDNATIKWSTQSEQNTSHYVVERSVDGQRFKAVGAQVAAAGNSADKRNYQSADNIADVMQNDVIYYRVRLFDIDGKETYSNVVAIRLQKKTGASVWPNPFQQSFTISVTSTRETTVSVRLTDVNGAIVRKMDQPVAKGKTNITISNLTQLAAGTYLVEIKDNAGGSTFQKIIKM